MIRGCNYDASWMKNTYHSKQQKNTATNSNIFHSQYSKDRNNYRSNRHHSNNDNKDKYHSKSFQEANITATAAHITATPSPLSLGTGVLILSKVWVIGGGRPPKVLKFNR